MLHSTLSALLVSVASRYAQLSPSDVGIGIGGGRLVIDNVQLRADTFNAPQIPFRVHEGRAGRLRINVPWSALSSTPVKIYLENVHLIAGPKQNQQDESADRIKKKKHPTDLSSPQGEWHQTMVGRLLFNVSVEVYGLKIEYRDDVCVGIISIASLRANSAGPDWNQRFVSLLSDLDPEQPEASAVSMRKLVHLGGVHWVMIPRVRGAPPAAEGLAVSEQGRSPRFSERHLDLSSYESKSPILDGIAVTVRVLMCTGMALVGESISPGLHAEVDIDLEETSVSLTAQQIKWIDQILKEGLGVARKRDTKPNTQLNAPKTKRRPRSFSTSQIELQTESVYPESDMPAEGNVRPDELLPEKAEIQPPDESIGNGDYYPKESNSSAENDSAIGTKVDIPLDIAQRETTETEHAERKEEDETGLLEDEDEVFLEGEDGKLADGESIGGGFRSFWQAIVGEYADETVDDAAIALGLENGYTSTDEEEYHPSGKGEDDADIQYAREAVNAAAMAGGRTFKLRLKTPDLAAWDEVEKLREDLQKEKERREELEDVEKVLYKVESRVKDSENIIQQLQERNAALVKELRDLEGMASQSGRNKDAIIRQMEAALAKAEKSLQTVYQTRFEQQNGPIVKSENNLEVDDSSPRSIEQDSTEETFKSAVQGAEVEVRVEDREAEDQAIVGGPVASEVDKTTSSPHIAVPVDEAAETQTSPTLQTKSSSGTPENLTIVSVSDSEQTEERSIESNNLDVAQTVIGAPSRVEEQFGHQFGQGPTGITSKNIELSMSAEGLTLV